ncbi:MAG: glutamate synthase subunit beta [Magnetococcales bacterium]|nr:glutamate synthase subunit beta [Magnetococcales bacterium]MBF0116072.1 glutamate synthase subunit beta [Magnetococcales bacterium]
MGKITGFIEIERVTPSLRPVAERITDWDALYQPFARERIQEQAARCMDCGVPFCHSGCTLGNLIPQWNDWVYKGQWALAVETLHRTNNFPEFTGNVCPALCETSCVVGINREPVSIRQIERTIVEEGFARGLIVPRPAKEKSGKRVAVIGSGPAGMAAAQQLTRAGHAVTLYEKARKVGGLLRYGIPNFKLEKQIIDRRLQQMIEEGLTVRTGVHVGVDLPVEQLRREYDAILLVGGAEHPRDLTIPGRELRGIHYAMDFLGQQNRRLGGEDLSGEQAILATNRHVVVIGGGDTGADCVGTSVRQGAKSVTQIELLPKPPKDRSTETPWPMWPVQLRISTSHQEGCTQEWSVLTKNFEGEEGQVKRLQCVRLNWREPESGGRPLMEEIAGSAFVLQAELVLLAMGFVAPVKSGLLEGLGVEMDARGNVCVDDGYATSVEGVFAAGDMATGQSLVLKAIYGGRQAAKAIDGWLRGGESILP